MGMGSGFRRRRMALAVLGGLAAGIAAGEAPAQQPSAADIQWAQTILKEKGFDIGGRANGQMTPGTRQALSGYQRSVGLPVTGQLDSATVAKMLGDRKTNPAVGNLAAPKPGGAGSGAREVQRDVTPRAAPTQRIEGAGADADVAYNPVVRGPGSPAAAPPAHSEAPAPQAAPRAAVNATTGGGQAVATTAAAKDEPTGWHAPKWAGYGVIGVIVATLGYLLVGWWRSGRTAAVPAMADRGAPTFDGRREPTFGRRDELTAGPLPPLTAERRARR